jgi:signal peptidase I
VADLPLGDLLPGGAAKPKSKSGGGQVIEFVVIVVVAIGLALGIQALLVKPYRIPSESMEPTLDVGQRVLVNRIGNRFVDPEIGEVLVFHPPKGSDVNQCGAPAEEGQPCPRPTPDRSDVNFIKRVVAGPGDKIAISNGRVVLNGRLQKESFVRPCREGDTCDFPQSITIPPDHYFMMGDNRGSSDDSRFWGPVPKKWIIGGAFATYWPPGRLGLL